VAELIPDIRNHMSRAEQVFAFMGCAVLAVDDARGERDHGQG